MEQVSKDGWAVVNHRNELMCRILFRNKNSANKAIEEAGFPIGANVMVVPASITISTGN